MAYYDRYGQEITLDQLLSAIQGTPLPDYNPEASAMASLGPPQPIQTAPGVPPMPSPASGVASAPPQVTPPPGFTPQGMGGQPVPTSGGIPLLPSAPPPETTFSTARGPAIQPQAATPQPQQGPDAGSWWAQQEAKQGREKLIRDKLDADMDLASPEEGRESDVDKLRGIQAHMFTQPPALIMENQRERTRWRMDERARRTEEQRRKRMSVSPEERRAKADERRAAAAKRRSSGVTKPGTAEGYAKEMGGKYMSGYSGPEVEEAIFSRGEKPLTKKELLAMAAAKQRRA